jgi:hypothetical protein
MKRNRRMTVGIVSALLLCVGGLAAFSLLRERLLLERATHVLTWASSGAGPGYDYSWLSDHELLYRNADGVLRRLDTRTGIQTILPRQIQQSGNRSFALSPDGKWLLWGWSGRGARTVVSMDGFQRYTWPTRADSSIAYWLPNGRYWMQGDLGESGAWTQFAMHDMETPHRDRDLGAPSGGIRDLEILSVQSEDRIIVRTRDAIAMRNFDLCGGIIAAARGPINRATQELSIWKPKASQPSQQYKIRLPGPVEGVFVSPHGDRVAWLVMREPSSMAIRLHARFPRWFAEPYPSAVLYVSRLDGSRLRELGCMDTHDRGIGEVRWMPDGEHLSFVVNVCNAKPALWTILAE